MLYIVSGVFIDGSGNDLTRTSRRIVVQCRRLLARSLFPHAYNDQLPTARTLAG